MDETRTPSLASGFLESTNKFPERPALVVDGKTFSYRELHARASVLAATLIRRSLSDGSALTAVLGARSATAFTGVLAALLRGHGYVPLNPGFQADRTRVMLERSECRALVVDGPSEALLEKVLTDFETPLLLVLPDREDVSELVARWPQHTMLGAGDIAGGEDFEPAVPEGDDIAYLLFTSGSTGIPKGVMISHENIAHFLDVTRDRYGLTEQDRFSHTFDMVFDLSVFDLFAAWSCGGCLQCPTRAELFAPGNYILDTDITVWFSVPSVAVLMNRLGVLEPGAFPNLRVSLFCGEALPADVAAAWAAAAPNSVVENLYGPTEVTLSCTTYRWKGDESLQESENGVVPIGEAFPGMTAMVADESGVEVAPGESGELLMSGPQTAPGYWRDPERTAQAFFVPPGQDEIFYRTGDLVRLAQDGGLKYLGRIDHQIKIRGFRVELGEIEAALKDASGAGRAVAVGWPVSAGGADGIVAFLETEDADPKQVRRTLMGRLPNYMTPKEIRLVAKFPENSNGKVDRKKLIAMLEE